MVKSPPANRETWVWSLDWKDTLEKGKATHSSILAWIIPWTKEPGRLQSMGSQRVGHDWATFIFMCRVHHVKSQFRWITSWNQVCQENCQQPHICRWYHSNGRKWRETKELPEGEREEWKSWLETQHYTTSMISSPITSWQIEGGKVEAVTDLIFLGSKITTDSDCSHEWEDDYFSAGKQWQT